MTMMIQKARQKGFGAPEAAIICVLILTIGLLGWKYMDAQQNKSDNKSIKETSSSVESDKKNKNSISELSIEDEKIAVARVVCAHSGPDFTDAFLEYTSRQVTIENSIYAQFGGICADHEIQNIGGFVAFLIKENGSWVELAGGNGDLPCDELQSRGFPQSMVEFCGGPSFE